jgi:hypothetical protein
VAEQAAAREAAAARAQEASLLEGLVRRSAEEAALGQRLWQLRQEKAAMEENRKLREQQYAAQKDKEWASALLREQELHRWGRRGAGGAAYSMGSSVFFAFLRCCTTLVGSGR